MRIYGSVQVRFWENEKIQRLSDQAKLLAIYLLTGPHSNMLGCFRIPEGYIKEDLNWCQKTVKSTLQELRSIDFLTFDEKNSWLVVHDFLKWNPIQNPRQGVGVQKIFSLVPVESAIFKPLVNSLNRYAKYLDKEFSDGLKELISSIDCSELNSTTDKKQNNNQDKEQNTFYCSADEYEAELIDDHVSVKSQTMKAYKSQAIEILNFLNNRTGREYRPVDSNLKLIIARLKSGASITDCRQVIAKKTREWKSNPTMAEYLRPATLFNATKFEQYLGELGSPDEGATNEIQ